jgi:hypothetical protein
LWNEVKPCIEAIRKFPERVMALIRELFPLAPERVEQREIRQPEN